MQQPREERRDGPRVRVQRGAKLSVNGGAGRFLPARTVNVSARGVLLEVESARPLEIGQGACVAIQWQNAALLRAGGMLPGCIVRTERTGPAGQRIAIRLERSLAATQTGGAPIRAAA